MVLSRQEALEEARRQKEALKTIGGWRRVLFLLTGCLVLVAVVGIRRGDGWFVPGVVAAVAGAVCLLLTLTVNLSIRNGHRNVERILESLKRTERSSSREAV